jgi:hypothetical protein
LNALPTIFKQSINEILSSLLRAILLGPSAYGSRNDLARTAPTLVVLETSCSKMHFLAHILLSITLAIVAVGRQGDDVPPQIQSFAATCAYNGSNITDDHWLHMYCRNSDVQIFGYNYSWYLFRPRVAFLAYD